jgi:Amt family ammonium transporter
MNTSTATSAAMLGWLVAEKLLHGKATGIGAASGAVAGLVAITPAAGFVSPVGAIVIGLLAGGICAWAIGLKNRLGLDDALDVGGVHLIGGIIGTVTIGFFSTSTGLFYGGNADQLVIQIIIAAFAILFSGILTLVIGLGLKSTMGLRLDEEVEYAGDTAIHGESAYDFEGGSGIGAGGVPSGSIAKHSEHVEEGANA